MHSNAAADPKDAGGVTPLASTIRSSNAPPQSGGTGGTAVAQWHAALSAIAVLNVALWLGCAVAVTHAPGATGAAAMQLLLSGVYVLGCAFRSALPVYDIPRIVLVDSRFSSVLLGRSVATVAELCFAIQWALILQRIGSVSHNSFAQLVAQAIVPLIVLAEGFSWYAVLTTTQRGHVLENSLWGAAAALLVVSLLLIGPARIAALSALLVGWCIGGAAYALFMFLFDVPMYWSRWRADQASGRRYLSIRQGLLELRRRRVVSARWEDWRTEVTWMSLYFTFGVWSSISIVYASLALVAHS